MQPTLQLRVVIRSSKALPTNSVLLTRVWVFWVVLEPQNFLGASNQRVLENGTFMHSMWCLVHERESPLMCTLCKVKYWCVHERNKSCFSNLQRLTCRERSGAVTSKQFILIVNWRLCVRKHRKAKQVVWVLKGIVFERVIKEQSREGDSEAKAVIKQGSRRTTLTWGREIKRDSNQLWLKIGCESFFHILTNELWLWTSKLKYNLWSNSISSLAGDDWLIIREPFSTSAIICVYWTILQSGIPTKLHK